MREDRKAEMNTNEACGVGKHEGLIESGRCHFSIKVHC